MNKHDTQVFYRVVKRASNNGKFIRKQQNGASGRCVVTVNSNTYNKGVKAASKLIREKA